MIKSKFYFYKNFLVNLLAGCYSFFRSKNIDLTLSLDHFYSYELCLFCLEVHDRKIKRWHEKIIQ
jgi:hypothetical protein